MYVSNDAPSVLDNYVISYLKNINFIVNMEGVKVPILVRGHELLPNEVVRIDYINFNDMGRLDILTEDLPLNELFLTVGELEEILKTVDI
ncbi:hypothetical protein KY334_00395, partial [Candidatus Woesearchaeota archaeon]|nr:hypothetical protein [Candidatus Woesearchaeota archaeon]